ncbi:MAG: CHASE2 domain-containing protein [Spirochaetaceae bacterium]
MKKARIISSIPVLLVGLVIALNLLPGFRGTDLRLFDWLLPLRPAIEEDERFVILQIDDNAISMVGGWPWSRDVIANGMWTLRELGADRMVFDIEYMDQSPSGVDRQRMEVEVPRLIETEMSQVLGFSLELIDAFAEGRFPPEEARFLTEDLVEEGEAIQRSLIENVQGIARDNDLYMGRAASAFERAFYTVTLLDIPQQIAPTTPEDLEFARENFAIAEAPEEHGLERAATIQPVIQPIGSRAAGAGFTNVVVDPDGVRRRISILAEYEGELLGQLAFVPMWDLLGRPEIEVEGRRITLRDAEMPGEENPRDIVIPLTTDHRMIMNWPQKPFAESFRQASYAQLISYEGLLEDLYVELSNMEANNYNQFFDEIFPTILYEEAEEVQRRYMIEEDDSVGFEEYSALREEYLAVSGRLLEGETENSILDYIDEIRAETMDPDDLAELDLFVDFVRELFSDTREVYEAVIEQRDALSEFFDGAFVIIGQTGVGTVDIGVNPFEGEYFNVGTHAVVPNTILQEDFIVEEPRWVSLVLAAILGLGVGLGTLKLDTKRSIFFGVVSLILVGGGGAAYFVFTSRYVPLVTPLGAVLVAFISSSAISSVRNSAERAFLRNAFSRYLSADVIGQIIEDPSRLNLGGEKRLLTAMFTDVQGFSTISEQLDPTDLVKLLNAYLSAMSDIVLDVRGTIDKYEGDAIIAFFGAPIEDPDHAVHACESAIKMKRTELELNERFLADGMSPTPLATRIGINTGDMVVGNMGTERKMDYTIMGHSVNLAARLEGVNKQYGSFILTSEATRARCGNRFLFRAFDQVRVVGVTEPVQLYELLDERSEASAGLIERVEAFEAALELFRGRRFAEAKKIFSDLLKQNADDGPSKTYLKRCTAYLETPPPDKWDGVYNLTQK